MTLSQTIASTDSSRPKEHVTAHPPADVSSSSCESETYAYSYAYAQYEAAVNTLNDAYDALLECQNGGSGEPEPEPEPEHYAELARLPSILEAR